MDINREDVMCVHDGQSNEQLIEQLRKFKDYLLSEDVPTWQQLIATAGFVIDVVKMLKWSDYKGRFSFTEIPFMSFDDVCTEITAAVNHYIAAPFADELNAMWQDWHFNDTGKYADIETSSDMCGIIIERLEQEYPDLLEREIRYFKYED